MGDLIIRLFRRAGESVLPVLPDLLQAMLVHMQTAQTVSFLQSLIIPFAFIYKHCDAMLESTRVGEEGRLGLDVMLINNKWTDSHPRKYLSSHTLSPSADFPSYAGLHSSIIPFTPDPVTC